MAKLFERVDPGDLITASYMNGVLETIEKLDDRISKLEIVGPADNRVSITGLDPSGPYRLGQKLTVTGKNFEYTTGGLQVYVSGVQVIRFIQASDTKLVFNIPDNISDISETGTNVFLSVLNSSSSDTRIITLKPAQQSLTGFVDVVFQSVNPLTITENQQADFMYKLTPHTSIPASFVINPNISEATNLQEWQNKIKVLVPDEHNNLIETNQIALGTTGDKVFYIRITSVPAGTNNTTFKLSVNLSSGGVIYGSDNLRKFTVGVQSEEPDTTFDFSLSPPYTILSSDHKTITLKAGTKGTIYMTAANFSFPGKYYYSATTTATGWNITRSAETPPFDNVTASDLTVARDVIFELNPISTASGSGDVEFIVQREGETKKRTIPLKLQLI